MSACIYHEAEAVTICPGCDFGVCQACMDGGGDGVCATCFEERQSRQESSAPAAEVRRCNYCRAAEDDLTTIDEEGYCEACRVLPRCSDHSELIAVGQCKGCRQEFCRKCLGFTDYCQSCAAKEKAKPQVPRPPAAPARPAGAKKKRPAGARPPAGKAPSKRGDGAGKASGKGPAEAGARKRKPSRGREALQARLEAKSSGRGRVGIIVVAVVCALGLLTFLSGMYLQATSPEEQVKQLEDQMVVVHRAVRHYQHVVGHLPNSPRDIYRSLADMKVSNYRQIHVALLSTDLPKRSILYSHKGATFTICASDGTGNLLKTPSGGVISLDQSFDSSSQ